MVCNDRNFSTLIKVGRLLTKEFNFSLKSRLFSDHDTQ